MRSIKIKTIRDVPLFPLIPLLPVAILAGALATSIRALMRVRRLERWMAGHGA
jgi:hypothetical protein